ncbi:MAG: N-acetylmuramoyl-L-alanine amidase [Hellea sp.]
MPYLRKSARRIETVIVHSTATQPRMKVTVADIDRWHKERTPPFSEIGYHLVIYRDGSAHLGRDIDKMGAHAYRHNRGSIGIVMVGGLSGAHRAEANYTSAQFATLSKILDEQESYYPGLQIKGHRDTKATACPSFNVGHWRETGEVKA